MSFSLCAVLVALGLLACTSAGPSAGVETVGQQSRSGEERSAPGLVVSGSPSQPQASPTSAATRPDAVLDTLRELLDRASKARAENDHAWARTRIASAMQRALSDLGQREDDAALDLLEEMARFAYDSGELNWAEKARRRVLEVRTKTCPEDSADLQAARQALARTLYSLDDLRGARALAEKVLGARSRTLPEDHPDMQQARHSLAAILSTLGDFKDARALQEKVLEVRERILPDEDRDLQAARLNLSITLHALGEYERARTLRERVLEVRTRTLPADDMDLQTVRRILAESLRSLGDFKGSRALEKQVLDVFSRILPEDDLELQVVRGNLAVMTRRLGDPQSARVLEERVLEIRLRVLPEDHADVQLARLNLAATLTELGELARARTLQEKALEAYTRTLPEDELDLQRARLDLGNTIRSLGDCRGARDLLEKVLEVRSRRLPEDHIDLQAARQSLAAAKFLLGDFRGARVLTEKVLENFSRILPDDHHDLQTERLKLAASLNALGDVQGARALMEKVLEVLSRTLPEDDTDLQKARGSLAVALKATGHTEDARALEERVLEVFSRTLPKDDPDLQKARLNVAAMSYSIGDFQRARELQEKALEVLTRTMPDDYADLQVARTNLASTIKALGDLQGARALQQQALEVLSRTAPEHPQLRCSLHNLAGTLANIPDLAALEPVAADFSRIVRAFMHNAVLTSSSREAEERVANDSKHVSLSLSFADVLAAQGRNGTSASDALTLVETARGVSLVAAALRNRLRGDPEAQGWFDRAAKASVELTGLAQAGVGSDAFRAAVRERDESQRAISAIATRRKDLEGLLAEPRPEILGKALSANQALVGYWVYSRSGWEQANASGITQARSGAYLLAHVVRRDGSFSRVDLGPTEPIEQAVEAWRAALVVGDGDRGVPVGKSPVAARRIDEQGRALRRLVFDPLREALQGADEVVFAVDDVLHLVPMDALPLDEPAPGLQPGGLLIGDRWRIGTRTTLTELLDRPEAKGLSGRLVVVGGVTYGPGSQPIAPAAGEPADMRAGPGRDAAGTALAAMGAERAGRRDQDAGILREGVWSRGFPDLPGTRLEAHEIVQGFRAQSGDQTPPVLLEGSQATRELLLATAPSARWLHVATHGWFAVESIRSWKDPEPLDPMSGLGARMSGEEQVRGMSPLLLCGLALAGANQPENELGRVPGLVTAEELSALDLSHCKLAVLSACDTGVGDMRRAGQGVASLQMALQMAGARSVITSLWKVPDQATKDLMVDFYRRLWVEKKPKWQALWEAKMKLRGAKDEYGHPKYSLRDWGAWVLTGDPD